MDRDEWIGTTLNETGCFLEKVVVFSSEMGSETMGKGSPRPMKFESQPKYLYFDSLMVTRKKF